MAEKSNNKKLFPEFSPVTTKEWEEKINIDLKGADYEKKLIWKTIEGINAKPYYRKENLESLTYLNAPPSEFPYIRGNKNENAWEVRQDTEELKADKANRIALDAISKGANAIGFNAKEIELSSEMEILLKGIDLTNISIHFTAANSFPVIFSLFNEEVKRQKIDTSLVRGSFSFDPLGYYLLYEKYFSSQHENFNEAASYVNNVAKELPNFKVITVNGSSFHNAGASIVQEIAFSLSSANEYLAQLTENNISVDQIAPKMQFVFAMGSNYFMEIAKLRAARLLWAKIVEQYKPKNEKSMQMHIHAVTSSWNKTIYDPYNNMLRNTTEAMSAAIGGCDSMTVYPFDATFKKSDDISERIARNTQLILKSESYLDKVTDPAAGSYYIENLTHLIIEESWKLFLAIEKNGGFIKSIESGYIKQEIEKVCQKRDMDIAMRKQIFVGVNQYPNLKENQLEHIRPHAKVNELAKLKQYRGAHTFEALRLSTEAYEKAGNKKPTVFLFTYGNLTMRKARAGFATNFFGCLGYTLIDNPGFKTAEEGINAAISSKADFIVFCSSDDEYVTFVPEASNKIKTAKNDVHLIVAGNPVDSVSQLKEAGVSDFIHVRTNVLETLGKYQHLMGII